MRNSLLGGQSIACMVRVATTLFSNVWNNRRQGQGNGCFGRRIWRMDAKITLAWILRYTLPPVCWIHHIFGDPCRLRDTIEHRSMAGLAGIWVHLAGFAVPPAELGGIRRIHCTYFHGNKPSSLRTLRDRQRQTLWSTFLNLPCSLFLIS